MRCGLEESGIPLVINIVSIVIQKDPGNHVASITDYRKAKANPFMEDVRVEGDVSGTSGDQR